MLLSDLLHPVDDLAVELFRNGDMRHTRDCRGSMPMFDARWNLNDIALLHFLNWAAPLLDQASPGRDDQRLSQRVDVRSGASARLECDNPTANARGIASLEWGMDTYGTLEIFDRSFG